VNRSPARARGIVALDVSSEAESGLLVERLGDDVSFYKIGLELFTAGGPGAVEDLRARGKRVFLDLKLHDIPTTVERAARQVSRLGVELLTVHAGGGRDMVRAAVDAAPNVKILAVTALTSLDPERLPSHFRRDLGLADVVSQLTEEALEAGAAGVVLSGAEVAKIKARFGPRCLCVVPGIRPKDSPRHDQARAVTAAEALAAGADYLVVGRTVTGSADPLAAWRNLWSEAEMSLASPKGAPEGAR
jgi:orotidine-5'-phosphate decarboxylase